jgi:uncharacterized protein YdeI (YjbR/CyaY-like superfamily)
MNGKSGNRSKAKPAKQPESKPEPKLENHQDGLPILGFANDGKWSAWLEKHHLASKGLWVRLERVARAGAEKAPLTYAQAVLTALCFGWIDGQKAAGDETAWLQKFTPRGPRSVWSKLNRVRVAGLIEAGRMRPAGAAAVERAKKGGQWEAAYDTPKTASVPPEFQAELDKSKAAAAFFATLNSANRYAMIWRIQTAKKPETKTRRIQTFIAMLEKKEMLYP